MDLDDEGAVRAQVAALALSGDELRRVICGLVGHSRVVDDYGDGPAWVVTCARCGAALLSLKDFDAHGAVFRRHIEAQDCATCADNRAHLTWRDLWEVQLGQTDGRE
jgi:hypothetical protein